MIAFLILAFLFGTLAAFLALPSFLWRFDTTRKTFFPRFLFPTILCDPVSGAFGFTAAPWYRNWAVSITIAIDGIVTAIASAITKRKVSWLYRPVRSIIELPEFSCEPSPADRKAYLDHAAAFLSQMLATNGWRSWLIRGVASMPRDRKDGKIFVELVLY